ncbi:MAG: TonB-dependent receptor [Terracidiphilus sp.]|nr:TonB-dependent receptor [Terracidiphilus sp.]
MKNLLNRWHIAIALVCLIALGVPNRPLHAQESATGSIQGTIVDQSGQAVQHASVSVSSNSEREYAAVSNAEGKFAVSGLKPGSYSLQVSSTGFAVKEQRGIVVTAGRPTPVSVALSMASVSEEVTVEAEADDSVAVQLATVKALLDMASPRSEITSQYIRQFTSPVTDFSDITQAAPGTVSYSTNGIGNGQAKTWFRGFKDGDFTMTWDGVPFQDSNDPTHHSWAYVPAPAISYVDFDRSPGTASDVGPTNFAGSVHMFSPKLGDDMTIKGSETYGSFNTQEYLGEFNSGVFGGSNPKSHLWFEGHHMTSDGYQTNNDQQRTAGTVKYNYKASDKTSLTLVGTSVIVDSNTPDSDPTRQQIAVHGLNYIMDSNPTNPDGTANSMYYRYYTYHVPTNFEVATFSTELGHNWKLESKPYTYSYSNHQHLFKNQSQELTGLKDSSGNWIYKPVSVAVTSTSAVNKLNQYNRIGEIATVSAASRFGVFRAGAWYEFTTTHRYQVKSDPRTWVDSTKLADLKFHEHFITQSVQPFIEYQLVAIPKWTITAGLKSAAYNMHLKQYADGSTVGSLNGAPYVTHNAFYNNLLPSFEANYRIRSNWSAYGQYGRGSEIPPSSVFDVTGAQVAVTPSPTTASTYQGGTVLKLNRVLFDADVYHINYESAYSSYKVTDATKADYGDSYYYSTPSRNTTGFEAEGNLVLMRGLSAVLNGTFGEAKYDSAKATTLGNGTVIPASGVVWVAGVAKNTASGGLTYQNKGWDLGFFNKRVGSRFVDNGSVHEATQLDPFWMNNLFANYTLRSHSIFDQSKVKLSINNLFDNHDVVGLSPGVSATSTVLYKQDGTDQLQLLPGRSVMISFQVGFAPKGR